MAPLKVKETCHCTHLGKRPSECRYVLEILNFLKPENARYHCTFMHLAKSASTSIKPYLQLSTGSLPFSQPPLVPFYLWLASAKPTLFLRFGLTATPLLSLTGERFAVPLVNPHKNIAPLVVSPAEWRLNRSTRHPGPLQQIKRGSHDRTLHPCVPWLPAGVSQREVGEYEASNAAFLDDITGRTH